MVSAENKNIIFCNIVVIIGAIVFLYGLETMYQIPFIVGGTVMLIGLTMRLNVFGIMRPHIFKD